MFKVKAKVDILHSMVASAMNLAYYSANPFNKSGDILYHKNSYYFVREMKNRNLWNEIYTTYHVYRVGSSGLIFPDRLFNEYFITKIDNRDLQLKELLS